MKKKATVLTCHNADEFSGHTSILFICFSDYFDVFLPGGIFVCHELIELTEWNLNEHVCTKY